jgi:hypothetical protein
MVPELSDFFTKSKPLKSQIYRAFCEEMGKEM